MLPGGESVLPCTRTAPMVCAETDAEISFPARPTEIQESHGHCPRLVSGPFKMTHVAGQAWAGIAVDANE